MLYIKEANITVDAAGDGIKSTNDTDTNLGSLYIIDSSLNIKAKQDGIQSENVLTILNSNIDIITGEGSRAALQTSSNNMRGFVNKGEVQNTSSDTSTSMKALKAVNEINIEEGKYTIDSQDDSIHSNGNIIINSGEFEISSGDDGIHADTTININGGNINIAKSYEGIEAANIVINYGNVHVVASDDGINVAGGNDGSSLEERPGQNAFTQNLNNSYTLEVNGGYLYVDAVGDGLDSNGSVEINGGTVIVNGPTNDGNGTLDYATNFNVKGGVLIAAGSSGMLQTVSQSSTQNTVTVVFEETKQANTIVNIQNSNKEDIITFAPSKQFSSIVISTPNLKNGSGYTLNLGGSYSTTSDDGHYTNGTYTSGTTYQTFDITSVLTNIGNVRNNMMPGNGGGMPNNRGPMR